MSTSRPTGGTRAWPTTPTTAASATAAPTPTPTFSNTHLAIEALHHSRRLAQDSGQGQQPQLDWEAAIAFVSKCQNHQATNKNPKAGNDGGFVYFPGNSKAGEQENPDGTKTLRSYGSMSYAGLLSMVYAQLDARDPRVLAVKKWLAENYTLDENPGVGQQGLYYYYLTMAKTLTAANIAELQKDDGTKIDWRKDLAERLLQNQAPDGSWVNKNSRWWEADPVLVTSYVVLALEQIHHSLPE